MSTSSAGNLGSSIITMFIPWTIISAIILFFVGKKIITIRKEKMKSGEIRKLNTAFKVLCFLGCVVDFLFVTFITNWSFNGKEAIAMIIMFIIPGIITQCLYFLPYLIANSKGHTQETAIFILNLFAGWTIVAWIIALVWAFTKKTIVLPQKTLSNADEIAKFKNLLDSGVITEEEFENKKQELLNL